MTKKLFLVEACTSFEMAVWAEDEDEAEEIAQENAGDEFDNIGASFDCRVVNHSMPADLLDSIPYGSDDDHGDATVAEILAKGAGR